MFSFKSIKKTFVHNPPLRVNRLRICGDLDLCSLLSKTKV